MSSVQVLIFILSCMCIIFSNGITVNYAIEEEKGPDFYLGRISDGADIRNLPQITSDDEFQSLRYSLLTSGNQDAEYFTVNERTSDLYTTKNIDRDGLCRFTSDCALHFEVAADTSASNFFTKININVNIIDVNDNAPSFSSSAVNLALSESTVVNTIIWKDGASDMDYSSFSVQSYQLVPDNSPFSISSEFFPDGRTQVSLKVSHSLDREQNDSYSLTLIAIDGGEPRQSGSININIQITDINDNAPQFSKSTYNITVNEDLPENTVILRVSATDPDEGVNGEIHYKLSTLQSNDIVRLFSIDMQNGDLRIIKSLTQEERKQFKVIVEAIDKAVPPMKSKAEVIVNVLDTHNTAPEVKVTTIATKIDNDYVEYQENANIGLTLAVITVNDFDSGYNGAVTCTINDEHFLLQSQGNNEYSIVLGKTLDREVNEWHHIVTTCSDAGSPRLSSSDGFRLHVLDVNDLAPAFTQAMYKVSVQENGPISTSIAQVHANDNDVTATQNVLYSMNVVSDYRDIFSIDSTTGLIFIEKSLDREIYPKITFEVLAVDHQQPPLTGSAVVEVTIVDVNDNDPIFTPLEFQFTVLENQPQSLSVGRVVAVDSDSGKNAELDYTLLREGSGDLPFQVAVNGTIIATISLDREDVPSYKFYVMAADKGSPSRSSTAVVIVNVHDENDNPPVFIFPGQNTNDIVVSYQSLPNTVLATIQAVDPDTSFNSQISYFMNGTDILDNFELNTFTGQLSVISQLDQSYIGTYDIVLKAVDGGQLEQHRGVKLVIVDKTAIPSSQSENQIKYFAIAVSISCITVVLSILIVLAICLIKRKERQQHEKIAESVTTCSSLETDSEGSDVRFGEIYSRGILHKSNSLKKGGRSGGVNPIKKSFTTESCVDDVKPEIISDSIAIWDWSEFDRRSTANSDTEPFSTFSLKSKQKNKVHWQASQC